MEAFKKKEILFPGKDKKSKTEGIIVTVHLINDPDKIIGFVKQFL